MIIILSFLGVLYILDLINKNAYKLLPTINISNFFLRKLEIQEIDSVQDYIMAKIKMYTALKYIKNLNDNDLSNYDVAALTELKQYIISELKQYVIKATSNNITMLDQIDNHIQCTLKTGILDFYLSHNSLGIDCMRIKFQSFSQDGPSLEISTKTVSYTYKIKSKLIRFVNPNVELICEIRELLKTLPIKQASLQVA